MKRVEILATCRDQSLLPYTTLVFSTIRIGFPTAEIRVTGNDLPDYAVEALKKVIPEGCTFENKPAIIHHQWLEQLCSIDTEPFIALDTDVICYSKIEDWSFNTSLAGWRIPEWEDEFTKCCTRARLHTSLLFIDPVKLRDEVEKYMAQFPVTPFNPMANLFYPLCVPMNQHTYFYDTMAMMYHAIGGTAFTDEQLNAFYHMHFGTIPDVVLPHLSNGYEMGLERDRILKNPALGYGRWREANEYFAARQKQRDTKPLEIPPITPENSQKARDWNIAICKGDQDAMNCNNLAFSFFHALDDFRDEREDGRPKMNDEQTIEMFAITAAFYNCPFYVRNREMLFPIMLNITNSWADSLMWERSSLKHRRTIANVLSAVGDEFYMAVALICGGWSHMRAISGKLRERDWLSQHGENGERL